MARAERLLAGHQKTRKPRIGGESTCDGGGRAALNHWNACGPGDRSRSAGATRCREQAIDPEALTDDALSALVARAQASDPDAWEVLYRRAYGPLFRFARRRLRSDEHAEESVSETFVRAYQAIGRFRPRGGGFDAWLFTILRNVVLESFRRAGHRATVLAEPGSSTQPEPLEHVLHEEEAAAVRLAFERLSPGDRELLELRVIGELGTEDVASVLGKRPGAVRMAQARALKRLRKILQEREVLT